MELFTKKQFAKLLKNGADQNPDRDHPPVVKLFMTSSACTWLISELDPNNFDIAFGLCDIGMGCAELGSVSILELTQAQGFLRYLERDLSFGGKYPLSVYARAAREANTIVEDDRTLQKFVRNPQPR